MILGLLSFASGVMGSIGQHQSQSAAIAASNRERERQYKHQLYIRERSWNRELALYGNKINNYKTGMKEQNIAYGRAMAAEQYNLNQIYKKAKFEDQESAVKLATDQGALQAKMAERGGKTSARLNTALAAQFGRNQAIQTEELIGAQTQSGMRRQGLRDQLISDRRRAYSDVQVMPFPDAAPLAPTMQAGPSGLGLASGILGAAVSGYQTYNSLRPSLNKGD